MIDLILKVLDRLLDLVKQHRRRFHVHFEETVRPVFEDLLLIHKDYLQMIELVRLELGLRRNRPGAAALLSVLRTEWEPTREQLKALNHRGEDYDLNLGPEIQAFLSAVWGYLQPPEELAIISHSKDDPSTSSCLLEILEKTDMFEDDQARKAVDRALEFLREKWSEVCRAYAVAKLKASESP